MKLFGGRARPLAALAPHPVSEEFPERDLSLGSTTEATLDRMPGLEPPATNGHASGQAKLHAWQPEPRHVAALDGIRGIAILAVIAFHSSTLLQVFFQLSPARPIELLAQGGWVGVTLFFVLSGYLITGILMDTRRRSGYFRNFYARRFLRIFPVYYSVLLLILVVLPHANIFNLPITPLTEYWPAYFLYVTNVFVWVNHNWLNYYLDPTWSLAIEEQFYLAWPLLIWLISPRALSRVCVALVASAAAWRVGLLLIGSDPLGIYVSTPSHIDALAIGSFLAVRARTVGNLTHLKSRLLPIAVVSSLTVLVVVVIQRSLLVTGVAMEAGGYTALAILSAVLLTTALVTSQAGLLRRVLEHPFLRAMGRYSYAIYLLHELCAMLVLRAIVEHPELPRLVLATLGPTGFYIAFYLAVVGVSFAVGWCSWHVLERHFLALKRYFSFTPTLPTRAPIPAQSPSPVLVTTP
jgi:peptidoglycan/LPS O-acetylase OafA/YrhL